MTQEETQEEVSKDELDRAQALTHGQVCYLQIPARDSKRSAEFYADVFGWNIDAHHPDFTVPGSPVLIGQWVEDRPPARDAGPLLWIHVDDITATLDRVAARGGEVIESPTPDGPIRMLATILDPAGNPIGLAAHRRLSQKRGKRKAQKWSCGI
ncbi:MAG: VOC family protein [Streptosporangiaceae bacterium]|nr:VOC family protein [Streptosporangiaceae bacterium]